MTLSDSTIHDLEVQLQYLVGGDMELFDMSYAVTIAHLLVIERDRISDETKSILKEMYLL